MTGCERVRQGEWRGRILGWVGLCQELHVFREGDSAWSIPEALLLARGRGAGLGCRIRSWWGRSAC